MAVLALLILIHTIHTGGGNEVTRLPPVTKGKTSRLQTSSTDPLTAAPNNILPAKPAPQPVHSEPGDMLAAFDAWVTRYIKAGAAERAGIVEEGMQLAAERRPVFKKLIQDDPRRALEEAVRPLMRQKLPAEVVALLEQPLAARGVMRVYQAGPESVQNKQPSVLRYIETPQGETYRTYVYGRRAASVEWLPNVSAIGVHLDNQLALDERPLRVLEVGEIPPAELPIKTVCPISKIETPLPPTNEPITAQTPAIVANGEIVYLCDGSHTTLYEQVLIQGESSSGGAQSFTGILPSAPTPSVGVVKVLFIPAIFADEGQVPISEAGAYDMMKQTADFYQANSFGRLTLVATVTPPVRLPHNRAWYAGKDTTSGFIKEIDGLSFEMSHAKDEARKAGYDWQDYHATVCRASGGARASTSFGGGGNVWMRADSVSTATHEIGHAFGLAHANYWETNGASVIGPGGNVEYGDSYDNMGTGSPPNAHYNVQAKNQIKWLPDEFAPAITSSGLYRLYTFDQPKLDPGKRYGLRIKKDNDRTFWGEYRLLGGNNWTNNGMLLGWKWPNNSGSNLQLLDTTPGSINAKSDAGVTVGRTFSDTENGIHITTVAVNSNTTPASLDVQVNLGAFSGNQPPTLSLSPSSVVVPTNANVTFTATATDPDNDTLAYSWQWPDNVISGNAPSVTRSFSTAGIYTLSCVVSDMKGGIAVRNAVITVGNGNSRFTISGRITRNGAGIPNLSVTTGGANGTITDSDGYYVISNLTAGNYSVTPASYGMVFNELFNNSITVGPSFSGADFTTDDLPTVTISAPTAVAVEGGASGVFRISRTGPNSAPQTVLVFTVQGTAVKGTSTTNDYYFTPDYVSASPFQSFTIPANADFLDVVVAARNEGSSEGDETVTLVLADETSYIVGAQNSATITIQDANSALPRVSLTAAEAQTIENSGVPVTLTFTRTGSTAAVLSVPYTVAATSTATSATDYTALSGTVNIPIGASSASINVTPLDDAEPEAAESVNVTIATSASFIADASNNNVTVRIVDDDAQAVTVTATDATAQEIDRSVGGAVPNPGTFVVTRTGSTAAPLTVYYSMAGVALHGVDYDALPGSVFIPAGQAQASITIMPRYDGFGEGSETVILALGAGFGFYQLGATSSATVTITDNAADKPVIEVTNNPTPTSAPFTAAEPSTTAKFRITARGGSGSLVVNYSVAGTATAGMDYTLTGLNTATLTGSTTLTLTGGTVIQDLTLTPVNDATAEPQETIVLTLTSSANYSLWAPLATSTMFLRDDDQPAVFVDGQVGTSSADSIGESTTSTTCKFFVSRTGSTTSALTVNYSMAGTATAGTDYTNTNLTGSVVIPAGSAGVDISFNTITDTLFEGTESVIFHLESGSYATSADAKINIIDDDVGTQSVAFTSAGSAGSESTTSVNIPVSLNAPAAVPVSVEYSLEAGARTTTYLPGRWVRVVRTGTSFVTSTSPDGATWTTQSSTRTISMSSANYLAGICLTSASSGTSALATIDNVSITGLSVGGSSGAQAEADIGATNPVGASQLIGGMYQMSVGGSTISSATSDVFRYVYFPVTNSANCTLVARVVNYTGTSSLRVGAMIRESTAAGALHCTMLLNYVGNPDVNPTQVSRSTTNGVGTSSAGTLTTYTKPRWLRLARVGNDFTASLSPDGTTFTPVGGAQTMALSSQLLIGLAVSAGTDGQLAQGTFDNVTISPAPSGSLQDRTVGFVDAQGWSTQSSGTYVVTGSGTGIMTSNSATEDEAHFLSVPVTGDFTITTRLASISAANTTAQAGIMLRESTNYRARAVWMGLSAVASSNLEWRARRSATESGEGNGIDYTLAPGVLNFAIGDQTKNITLSITDDALIEPLEFVNVLLKNPTAAVLGGGPATFTYTIVDNDVITALPSVGFAASSSSGLENVSPVQIPVVLSESSASTVTVDFAITAGTASAGSDFTAATGTLTFTAGQTFATIPLTLLDDSLVESGETVTLTLSAPTNSVLSTATSHTFTITDDDTPVVTITASDATATEGGDTGAFTISRTGPTTAALSVSFSRTGTATSGTDFTALTSPFTIPIGQSSATLTVSPLNLDSTPETAETVIVTLSADSGYTVGTPSSATVTINDDDVNTVTLAATDAAASEAGSNGGVFTLTRTGPLTASLVVTLSATGTATAGADYPALAATQTFAVGQSVIDISVSILPDTLTEGSEEIVLSISSSSSYITGTPSVANITITDDDLPPSVFISSPSSKSTIISTANGLILQASGTDDGLPSPLTYAWSTLFGPGTITFGTPSAASTTATFSAPGVYGLRVTVNDGQFSASDDLIVQNGGFNYATWISQDQGPPATRGIAGDSNGAFTLIGSGTGYTSTADSGHMLFRQLFTAAGDATLTVRLTSLSGPGAQLAGITLRDTSWKSAKRVNLTVDASGTLQFNDRTTASAAVTPTASASGLALPRWLRLTRTGGTLTAAHAPDVSGAPGTFTDVGSSTVTVNNNLIVGMIVSAGASTAATATAVFDHVSVTPAISGAALHSEDIGAYTSGQIGSSSLSAGTITVNAYGTYDTSGGHFRYQQIWGDCILTAFLSSFNGSLRGAQAGVGLRDTTDSGAHSFYGNTAVDGYQVHWRSTPGGAGGTLQSSGTGWIRLVRKGNTVVAYKAPNVGGSPGTWTLNSGNLPVVVTGPLLVGLVVDANGSTLTTGTFTNLSIQPLNTAPVVDTGTLADLPPFNLNATVTDDGSPSPPALPTVTWSKLSGPGTVTFGNPAIEDTLATLSLSGSYALRLTADDGDSITFDDYTFTGYLSPFAKWLDQNSVGDENSITAESTLDMDHDGLLNLMEYAIGTNGTVQNGNPQVVSLASVNTDQYLRISIPKNPVATDVTFTVEATSDLQNWSSVGLVTEVNTSTQLTVRDSVPMGSGVRRFMRVRLVRP